MSSPVNLGNVRGATGAKGDKGDTGATGATGAKGDKGDTGEPGGVLPVTSTDNAAVRFNGTAGQVQNSNVRINDCNNPLRATLNPNAASIDAVDFVNTRGYRPGFHLSAYNGTAVDAPIYGTGSVYYTPWGNALTLACNLSYEYAGDSFTSTKFTVEPGQYLTTGGLLRYNANASSAGNSGVWEMAVSEASTGVGTTAVLKTLISARKNSLILSPTASDTKNVYATDVGVGLGITPTAQLDINSDVMRLRTAKTPASASAAGNQGSICWDANYVYVCIATNTWKRSAIATW